MQIKLELNEKSLRTGLILALAASVLLNAAYLVKYLQVKSQLKIYQSGALAMIGDRVEEIAQEGQDPGLYTLELLDAPADILRKAPRRVLPLPTRHRSP